MSDIRMAHDYIRVIWRWHTGTYEWHRNYTRVYKSDIEMTYEYIRVKYEWHTGKYGWHASTYWWNAIDIHVHEWYTDDILVDTRGAWYTHDEKETCEWHTSTCKWHMDALQVTYKLHASTYESHTVDIRMTYGRCKRKKCVST